MDFNGNTVSTKSTAKEKRDEEKTVVAKEIRDEEKTVVAKEIRDEENTVDVSYCTETHFKTLENKYKNVVFKDLRKLWDKYDPNLPWNKGDYNESNTLLLDDSPYKALLNPPNTSIFPHTFCYHDENDSSLAEGGELRVFLEGLRKAEDMRNYVKEHSIGQEAISETSDSWNFYSQVIESLSAEKFDLKRK
ncbi:hypothetical protein V8G54_011335 [Vigna mungo]|uniref:Mitochondrial import inner membrane translocase subunit TIM50 n=1 Tax=Vigna mungo TaxID=3915 RepID=A0AAQ3NNY3_VIGMU